MYLAPQAWWRAVTFGTGPADGLALTDAVLESWQRGTTLTGLALVVAIYAAAAVQELWRTWSPCRSSDWPVASRCWRRCTTPSRNGRASALRQRCAAPAGCALSVSCHDAGSAPVGLMIAGTQGTEHRVLAVGFAVEHVVTQRR